MLHVLLLLGIGGAGAWYLATHKEILSNLTSSNINPATGKPANPTLAPTVQQEQQVIQKALNPLPPSQKAPDIPQASYAQTVGGAASAGIGAGIAGGAALGAATAGIGVVVGVIALLHAHHEAAVKAEANSLNVAVPRYFARQKLILQGVQDGSLSRDQAWSEADLALTDYYAEVKNIISGKCNPRGPGDPDGWKPDPNIPEPCNGPCRIGCTWLNPHVNFLKVAIDDIALRGVHGVYTITAIPPHAGYNGQSSETIPY